MDVRSLGGHQLGLRPVSLGLLGGNAIPIPIHLACSAGNVQTGGVVSGALPPALLFRSGEVLAGAALLGAIRPAARLVSGAVVTGALVRGGVVRSCE